MKKMNWWSIANKRRRIDGFGIYYRGKTLFNERVERLKSLSESELRSMKENKSLKRYLEIKTGGNHGHGDLGVYEIAAGKREILGTAIGDGLKMIEAGKIGQLRKNWKNYRLVIKILDTAGLVDRKTGAVNRRAIQECLRENRIVHKR